MRKLTTILAAALLLAACTSEKEVKVNYKLWFNWNERQLPTDFSALGEPDMQGTLRNFDLIGIPDTLDHVTAYFEGDLKVVTPEEYTFNISTDDGSRLYVDGEKLTDTDGAHGPIQKIVSKQLDKGTHKIRIEWFDCDKGQSMFFTYKTPTISERQYNTKVKEDEFKKASDASFVKPQVAEAVKRFNAWKGDDTAVVFPMVTDIHTSDRFSYLHVGYAKEVAKAFGADFMVNFGDIGLNAFPATVDSVYAREVVNNIRSQMDLYDGIWLYTPGNHDFDKGEGAFYTEEDLSDIFQKPWAERAGDNLHIEPGRVIGWYDLPDKGLRLFFLNSQGTGTRNGCYYVFDDEQLQWLKAAIDSTPAEMQIALLAHYTPVLIGRWTAYTAHPEQYRLDSDAALIQILSDAAARRPIAGFYSGDSHFNFCVEEGGVSYFTSQGYGWCSKDLCPEGVKRAYFDYTETLCIDVVAIKPAVREVHTFRVGAGGEEFDETFNY